MGNILFEHNRKAYEAAVEMMEMTGRAAVIHPTGTGKSFLAFQLCADHRGEIVCWLSPSEYIFATQEEKWQQAGGDKLENIQFFTYAKLMRMGEEALAGLNPAYIILDEFHRCGAAQWGRGVKRLQKIYPQAKILGLSATNIRYLDNQRDMAWELFGGNVASELTLGAAIAKGILPAPKYVLSVYSYQKELERYQARVRQTKNRAVRDKAEKEFEALRRALGKADGLSEVFARHMLPGTAGKDCGAAELQNAVFCEGFDYKKEEFIIKDSPEGEKTAGLGKYIVFCANYNHLNEMKELAAEWFSGVDTAPHIYTAYSDDPGTLWEFKAFQTDKSTHLKLLYCIDMLNEGIHVEGVDGVILLRPTVSPTIYKQQIGRALATGGKKTPVIFDIVMNIENLCSIGAIEEELREAVLASGAADGEEGILKGRFQIIDEVKDCRRLFSQLNETLAASWDAMYAMAKEYYKTFGNLEVPASYTTADGYSLGAWVATQRKVYRGKTAGCLSTGQIKRLEAIGMCWQGRQEAAWEKNFRKAEKYYKEHGDLAVPATYVTKDGCHLGRWIRRQKEVGRKGKLGYPAKTMREEILASRMQRLEGIGMVLEGHDPWEHRFALAKKYYGEHRDLEMPADYVVEGIWLGRWIWEQKLRLAAGSDRQQEKKGIKPLSRCQIEMLSSIGLVSAMSKTELSWRQQYVEAEEFYREHGNLSIPKRYLGANGKKLGVWLQHQRVSRRGGQLAGWQVRLLDGIGMVWEFGDPWQNGFRHAQEYFCENGNLAVPNQYICKDGYRLGKWISNQRCAYGGRTKRGLSGEQVRQ
ncbi:MAG: Helicase associated domain protein, partial [Lachnospiraceae bacterium]|nr:Helicase associated domain protein [Lachnospiraceae bacterium]